MGYSLGVDLGTTYTAAAVSRGTYAEVVPLSGRAPQVPSVVYRPTQGGGLVFGETADRHATTDPERVAREFKRRMGDGTAIIIAGTPMSAHALSKALLGWVVEFVVNGQGEPPARLTVSLPANWGPYRRELMEQVTALNVDFPIGLCTEPEAAAVHFAASGRVAEGESIAVYDLGGGTFDAAVLRRGSDGAFELLGAPDGVERLGGVDFDDAVFEWVRAAIHLDDVDPDDEATLVEIARLRRDCTEAKEGLSTETDVAIPVRVGSQPTRVRLTRPEFEELIHPLVDDTVDSLERAIRRSGLAAADLTAVVLAGGSARIPLVGEMVVRRLGRPVAVSPQPKLCVAMGAALIGSSRLETSSGSTAKQSPRTVRPVVLRAAPVAPAAPGPTTVPPAAAAPAAPPAPAAPEAASALQAHAPAAADPATTHPPDPVPAPTHPVSLPPAEGKSSRRPLHWYRVASVGLAIAAVLLALFGPKTGADTHLVLDTQFKTEPGPWLPTDLLSPTLLGLKLPPGKPVGAVHGSFDLHAARLVLAGPVRAQLAVAGHHFPVLLDPPAKWTWHRLATIPAGVLAILLLFSLAYAESLLRGIRHRHRGATVGELLGLGWSGLVAGAALVIAVWIFASRLLEPQTCAGVVACLCVAVALLGLGWKRALPTEGVRQPQH